MGGKAQLKVNRPCVPLKLCFRQFVTNPFCEGVRFSASKLGNDIILLHFLIRLRLRLRTIASADDLYDKNSDITIIMLKFSFPDPMSASHVVVIPQISERPTSRLRCAIHNKPHVSAVRLVFGQIHYWNVELFWRASVHGLDSMKILLKARK